MFVRCVVVVYVCVSENGSANPDPPLPFCYQSRMSDAYHSCYVLSGLSSAQHQWELSTPAPRGDENEHGSSLEAVAADPVWTVLPYVGDDVQVFENRDLVRPLHPVFAIPQRNHEAMMNYFFAKEGF